MAEKQVKTNAMRILNSLQIKYEVITYKVDEDHLDALSVAQEAGLDPDCVFKTIVMINNDNKLFVFVTPACYEINLKKARELTNSKSIDLLKTDNLLKMTGYIRGGCSPLGMIKQYPTFIEESAFLCDKIYVSAGLRGAQLHISPSDLQIACNAEVASFI